MPTAVETTPRLRRSVIVRTLLRALATATLLVVLYYVAPMDTALDTHTVLLLTLCLAVFAAILIWRLRGITRSDYPGLRAVETLTVVVPLYILAFAATYYLAGRADSAYFSQTMTRTSALYFRLFSTKRGDRGAP